jgi:hypothetical protein
MRESALSSLILDVYFATHLAVTSDIELALGGVDLALRECASLDLHLDCRGGGRSNRSAFVPLPRKQSPSSSTEHRPDHPTTLLSSFLTLDAHLMLAGR